MTTIKTGRIFNCFKCGKEIYRTPTDQKKAPLGRFYCSKLCRRQKNLKQFARAKTQYLIKCGEIKIEKRCSKCGETNNIQIHHLDYNNPKDITTLCRKCHDVEHYQVRVALVESRRKHFNPCLCGNKAVVKGMCKACYMKHRVMVDKCLVPDCQRTQHTRGLCMTHSHNKRMKELFALPPKRRGPKPRTTTNA